LWIKHGCPPKSQAGSRGTLAFFELPDHLDRKLDVSWLGRQLVHKSAASRSRSILVEDRAAGVRQRRHEVGVIQDVENLRSELNVERFRNSTDRIVLGRGEIQVY
jgi:hypothetical protein